jgi:hypothetical protein
VELTDASLPGGRARGSLVAVSISGIAFEIDAPCHLAPRSVLAAEVVVGSCRVAGEMVVRDVRTVEEDRAEVGGLFRPASNEAELVWTGLIAGVEAAGAIPIGVR